MGSFLELSDDLVSLVLGLITMDSSDLAPSVSLKISEGVVDSSLSLAENQNS